MNAAELYDELAISFPPLWPESPKWTWINVHDGQGPNLQAISEIVDRTLSSSKVIVLVHSEPGVATWLPREEVARYVAQFILKHEVQVSDPQLNRFVSVNRHGLATDDA